MNREYHKWYSPLLQRDMEILIFGHGGRAVLFFPPRMGRFFDYENWGVVYAIRDKIKKGELQLFCVDSIDAESFYNNGVHPASRITRHLAYENYILHEVIPLMRAINNCGYLEVAGCSMGAYHTANIAMRYPALFNRVVCMSGRYDLTQGMEHFRDLFDGYHNEDIYFNMPRQFLANTADENYLKHIRNLDIVLAIGETDPFIDDNQHFNGLLRGKGINNQFYIWEGYAHRPRYWRQMVNVYL